MKRKTTTPGLVRFRKISGGSFHATIDGRQRIIKSGEIFDARPEEIPEGFRDVVIPCDPELAEKVEATPGQKKATTHQYFVKKRDKGVGYYDVVDAKGKVQNERALRKDKAEKLIEDLSK